MKVLLHNEWDLLSLITLYVHSTNLLFEETSEESAETFTNIGKWYADLKESSQSVKVLEKVTTQFDALEAGNAQYYLAIQHKRNKKFSEAIDAFVASLHFVDQRKKLHVLEQLAMIYEHQMKDYDQALYYTQEGINLIKKNEQWRVEQKQKWRISWEKRLLRLGNKK